jgi:hypothetical protein
LKMEPPFLRMGPPFLRTKPPFLTMEYPFLMMKSPDARLQAANARWAFPDARLEASWPRPAVPRRAGGANGPALAPDTGSWRAARRGGGGATRGSSPARPASRSVPGTARPIRAACRRHSSKSSRAATRARMTSFASGTITRASGAADPRRTVYTRPRAIRRPHYRGVCP